MGCIGGTVEKGETIEDALSREAFEEIGCKVAYARSIRPFSLDPARQPFRLANLNGFGNIAIVRFAQKLGTTKRITNAPNQ